MTTELLSGYQPSGPYVFQSGKHAGQCLEVLMFQDYGLLRWLLRQMGGHPEGKKNELHLHLEWLLGRGESVQPKMTCPQCRELPVQFFSVRYSGYSGRDFSVGVLYTYCKECVKSVDTAGEPIQILPFHFSSLSQFHSGSSQKQVAGLFRQVFNLTNRLSRKEAFEFFNSVEPYTD